MKSHNDGFIKGRVKGVKYAIKGIHTLVKSEDSIKAQLGFALFATIMGFLFSISNTEWMLQFLVIGLVLVAEAINTAIEKIADFIHPEYHEKIGAIKDIAAGAPAIAALISLLMAGIIYIPKIITLFSV
ncbi:diacylglycerol kinase [Tenacibaculum sp. SG-28]|uniref:diacylglycerol kinase n=1 Tax=Tenacibaculum sp. SG-28 TaxID=754426 RepID=UPI000CF39BE1|nr:diacylglycerol kinase family protein [Tenacibaculum sp. SG-28]PQJ23155.1 diacylglycerol kinase [Tenacibaculum sp. SG-28]